MSAPSIEPPKLPDLPIKEGPPDLPDLPKRPPSLAVGKRGGGPHLPSFANRKLRRPPGAPKPQAQTPLEQARSAPPAPKAPESLDKSKPKTPRHEAAQTQHELADALKKSENQAPSTFRKLGKHPKARASVAIAARNANVAMHGQIVKLQGRTRLAGNAAAAAQSGQPENAPIAQAAQPPAGDADEQRYYRLSERMANDPKSLTPDDVRFIEQHENSTKRPTKKREGLAEGHAFHLNQLDETRAKLRESEQTGSQP